jgi:hypothetical protein
MSRGLGRQAKATPSVSELEELDIQWLLQIVAGSGKPLTDEQI